MNHPYQRPVVPSVQPRSRGCAAAGVVVLTLLAVLCVVGGVWFLLSRERLETGRFEAAPVCAEGETEALAGLVPGYELALEEPVGNGQHAFGEGWQCRWATPEGQGEAVPAFATLVVVASPGPGGVLTAEDNFAHTTANPQTALVADLGDEAAAWYRAGGFPAGCVGVRESNLYLETCYGAAADYAVRNSVDEERALEGAEELARAAVAALSD
ncbi:hypothetical protein [Nocardiopsis sp. CNT312]|uniref:hypothetical protein n=1 Tax=Nocardiopsis sp. CNT312 TaxID=1137268 RepID=UPI00048A6912|nr:hypothetical protein [Nocardiopsis sp. CNT312]